MSEDAAEVLAEAEQIRAVRKARRDAERAKRDAEVAESRRVYERVDEATARARTALPGDVGEAVVALLDATKPWRASDRYTSSSAITRSSPEVLALAEALLAAQPAPSVPAGADVAAVLRELIELEDSAAGGSTFSGRYVKLRERALEALAATGARAAGGDVDFSGCRTCTCGAVVLMPDVHCAPDNAGRGFHRSDMGCSSEAAPPAPGAPGVAEVIYAGDADEGADLGEVATHAAARMRGWADLLDPALDRAAVDFDGEVLLGIRLELLQMAQQVDYAVMNERTPSRGGPGVRGEDVTSRAALPADSTPSAHGVAELLAMCAERQKRPMRVDRRMSCDEIVRYLAPEGGQS